MTDTTRSDDYFLGHGREEVDRLIRQAGYIAEQTEYFLRLAGLDAGMRVLEVLPDENMAGDRDVVGHDPVGDPEDDGSDVRAFADFMRSTKAPARGPITADVTAGEAVFNRIGCSTCHVASMTTAPAGTRINGGAMDVPEALGNKVSIRTATSCCTTSDPAMASPSCRRRNTPPPRHSFGRRRSGRSARGIA